VRIFFFWGGGGRHAIARQFQCKGACKDFGDLYKKSNYFDRLRGLGAAIACWGHQRDWPITKEPPGDRINNRWNRIASAANNYNANRNRPPAWPQSGAERPHSTRGSGGGKACRQCSTKKEQNAVPVIHFGNLPEIASVRYPAE